jgi:hypothetical protein
MRVPKCDDCRTTSLRLICHVSTWPAMARRLTPVRISGRPVRGLEPWTDAFGLFEHVLATLFGLLGPWRARPTIRRRKHPARARFSECLPEYHSPLPWQELCPVPERRGSGGVSDGEERRRVGMSLLAWKCCTTFRLIGPPRIGISNEGLDFRVTAWFGKTHLYR